MQGQTTFSGQVQVRLVDRRAVDRLREKERDEMMFRELALFFGTIAITAIVALLAVVKHPLPLVIGAGVATGLAILLLVFSIRERRRVRQAKSEIDEGETWVNVTATVGRPTLSATSAPSGTGVSSAPSGTGLSTPPSAG